MRGNIKIAKGRSTIAIILTTLAIATIAAPSAYAASRPSKRVVLGINGGVFVPTSGKTRDRFGSAWWGVGLGIGGVDKPNSKGRTDLDLRTLYNSSGANHAFLGMVGVAYQRAFQDKYDTQGNYYVPYYGATADLVLADLRSVRDNVLSGLNATGGGSVFVGTTIGENEFANLRYMVIPSVKGFNLSGVNLSIGVRF